jgi:REP-associated tyrosine transposase
VNRIIRRLHQAGVYFVTTDTWQRRAIFTKPETAQILLAQLFSCRDRGFYRLHAFAIMPNHLHILLTPGQDTTVEKALQMIKGGSARRLGLEKSRKLPVWQVGFHDRWVRDAAEYRNSKTYIEENPVAARLVERPEDYSLSSASQQFVLDTSPFD